MASCVVSAMVYYLETACGQHYTFRGGDSTSLVRGKESPRLLLRASPLLLGHHWLLATPLFGTMYSRREPHAHAAPRPRSPPGLFNQNHLDRDQVLRARARARLTRGPRSGTVFKAGSSLHCPDIADEMIGKWQSWSLPGDLVASSGSGRGRLRSAAIWSSRRPAAPDRGKRIVSGRREGQAGPEGR